jgi:hypothetical protein
MGPQDVDQFTPLSLLGYARELLTPRRMGVPPMQAGVFF